MKKTITLKSQELKDRAVAIIEALSFEPLHEVVIREHKKDRSLEQNALYWKWLTIIGEELGYSKEEAHMVYKERYLVNIFSRDDIEYAAMIGNIKLVGGAKGVSIMNKIIDMTSTVDASVKQMTEYLNSIALHAQELGIHLPFPEDRRL